MANCIQRVLWWMATRYARWLEWSPIGQPVSLRILVSRDLTLLGQTLRGVIANSVCDSDGVSSKAVVHLDSRLNYFGHYRRGGITGR